MAPLDRLVGAHDGRGDVGVAADLGVDVGFDGGKVVGGQRPRLAEVEAQAVSRDQGALLGDVVAQAAAQGLVQQMSRRVIGAQQGAARPIDRQLDHIVELTLALGHRAHVDMEVAQVFLGVANGQVGAAGAGDDAAVAGLTTGLAIERGLVDDQGHVRARSGLIDRGAVDHQGDNLGLGGLGLVAEKLGGAIVLADVEPNLLGGGVAGTRPGGSSLGPLALHGRVEAGAVDAEAATTQHVFGKVEGKTVGVVELEGDVAGQLGALVEIIGGLVEQSQATVEGLLEAGFLEFEGLGDQRFGAYQFREGGDGNGVVWAMPSSAPYPEPEECPRVEEALPEPPRPPGALDDLMDAIEGKRGEARYRPPFPTTAGLWGKPTIINNVETLMNIPRIIRNGAGWFNQMGTERSKGTKVFSVSGDVPKPGVYELVLGSSLRELVEGLALAKNTKMIQIGGATGRIVPYEQIDTPLTFESILGAGAVIVFDQSRDVIDIVHRTMEFLAEESCGKCTPCRQGTEVMVETLARFHRGEGLKKDLKDLADLSEVMTLTSLCGLGQAASNAVTDSLQYFKDAYESRVAGN